MVGIYGYGQIGRAIAQFYKPTEVLVKDIDEDNFREGMEFMHVCLPWNNSFIGLVKKAIDNYEPHIVIIHSTVPIGTTDKIRQYYPFTVHSPVRGVHPNLYEGIKKFVKYIGTDKESVGLAAQEHYQQLGIKSEIVYKSKNTEALKLADTLYYGWNILYQKWLYKYCEENNLDYDTIYIHANNTYNEGYMELGRSDVIRPILQQMEGGINGHCIISNAEILKKEDLPKFLLKQNKKYEDLLHT